MRNIDQMINQEVLLCVSTLVHDLTQSVSAYGRNEGKYHDDDLNLWTPVVDNDARTEYAEAQGWVWDKDAEEFQDEDGDAVEIDDCDAQEYAGEVFEHWAVTDWLANKLDSEGERIVRDWHGLTIWARTTTGQAISMDYVVRKIYDATHKTRVAFRVFEDVMGGVEVVALMPDEPWNSVSRDTVSSYSHVGQHGEASKSLLDELRPATEEEYTPLKTELERIGYAVAVVS